jgi:glucose/arabinose dehydrogenase
MRFYTGKVFLKEYRNSIFIVRHGSRNRSKKIGADVLVARLNPDGTVKSIEPFLTGFHPGQHLCRPACRHRVAEGRVDAGVRRL